MSALMNTLAGTIYQDFVAPCLSKNTSGRKASNIMKLLVVIIGLLSMGMVFLIERLGGILPLTISLSGITYGPLLGIFTLGVLFRSANSKGALAGGIGSLLVIGWIIIGAQYYIASGSLKHRPKPLSVEGCDFQVNITSSLNKTIIHKELPPYPYRITNYYYSVIGTVLVLLIGLPISWLTGGWNQVVHHNLLSPVVCCKRESGETPPPEYSMNEKL